MSKNGRTLFLTRDASELMPLTLWSRRPAWNPDPGRFESSGGKQLSLLHPSEAETLLGLDMQPGDVVRLRVTVED